MATKLGKVVTYYENVPPNKLHNPLNTWSREAMWQIKNISNTTVFSHQTWEWSYIQWGTSLHKVSRPFDHMILQSHMTN